MESWTTVAKTTTPTINPHVYTVGKSCTIMDLETPISVCVFLSTIRDLTLPQAAASWETPLGFCLLTHSCEVHGEMPGSRESNGKLANLWCLFVFTITSGSDAFSAMTWDLLRLQSFLLNLLIRFSLSSLRDRSSTLAPDEALRSKRGSRMDLSGVGEGRIGSLGLTDTTYYM